MMLTVMESAPCRQSQLPSREDTRLRAAIEMRLRFSSHRPVRRVRCEVLRGTALLVGVVPSYHMLQLALAAVAEVAGEFGIDNRQVRRPE